MAPRPLIATVTLNPSLDEWVELATLRAGSLNRASGFARYPGGKGINVSRVVRELGGRTIALGFAGGEDGLILRGLMNQCSLPHRFVEVPGTTRNNYKIRSTRPPGLTEINAPGPRVSPASLGRLERLLLARRPPPACVALSGSLPPGVPSTMYARWIRALRRRGVRALLDASGSALACGLRAGPWCIKPNREEAGELLKARLTRMSDARAAAEALLERGPSVVILSLGKDGAVMACASPRGVWVARPPSVKVDSAVGAGDSLVGGFLSGWTAGRSLVEAFRLGIACGAATAMTPGTELCHRADVRRLLRRVKIRQLA